MEASQDGETLDTSGIQAQNEAVSCPSGILEAADELELSRSTKHNAENSSTKTTPTNILQKDTLSFAEEKTEGEPERCLVSDPSAVIASSLATAVTDVAAEAATNGAPFHHPAPEAPTETDGSAAAPAGAVSARDAKVSANVEQNASNIAAALPLVRDASITTSTPEESSPAMQPIELTCHENVETEVHSSNSSPHVAIKEVRSPDEKAVDSKDGEPEKILRKEKAEVSCV